MMCRSPESRAGCHFGAAIGLRSMLENYAPEIPDYANDMHTAKGKAMGRGLDHFRWEGARLIPPPTEPDTYEDEAVVDHQAAAEMTAASLDQPQSLFVRCKKSSVLD